MRASCDGNASSATARVRNGTSDLTALRRLQNLQANIAHDLGIALP